MQSIELLRLTANYRRRKEWMSVIVKVLHSFSLSLSLWTSSQSVDRVHVHKVQTERQTDRHHSYITFFDFFTFLSMHDPESQSSTKMLWSFTISPLYVRVMSPVKVRNERHRGDRKTTEWNPKRKSLSSSPVLFSCTCLECPRVACGLYNALP